MVSSLGNKQKLSSDFQCITQYQTEPIDFASRLVTLSKSWIFSPVVLNLHLTSQLSGAGQKHRTRTLGWKLIWWVKPILGRSQRVPFSGQCSWIELQDVPYQGETYRSSLMDFSAG